MRPSAHPTGPSPDDAWAALLGKLRGYFEQGERAASTRIQVRLGVWEVAVEIDTGSSPRTLIQTPYVGSSSFGFVMTRRGLFSRLGALWPGRTVRVDAPGLDANFIFQSDDPFRCRLLFASPRLGELIALQPVSRLQAPTGAELSVEIKGAVASVEQLGYLYDLFVETLQQWREAGQSDRSLGAADSSRTGAGTPAAALLASVPVPAGPVGLAISPEGWRVYVASSASPILTILDTASNWVVGSVVLRSPGRGVAVSPDGQRVYVTHPGGDCLSVLDGMSGDVLATVAVARSPVDVTVSPDGARVYVACSVGNEVSVVDGETYQTLGTISLPHGALDVVLAPDGSRLYVTSAREGDGADAALLVIDPVSDRVLESVAVGRGAFGVAISPAGAEVYVANRADYSLSIVDTATRQVVASVPVAAEPVAIAVHPSGRLVFVTHADGARLSVVDTRSRSVVGTLAVGLSPYGIALAPSGAWAYVANSGSDTVSVVDARPEAWLPPAGRTAEADSTAARPRPLPSPAQPLAVLGQEGGTGAGIAAERHRLVPPNPRD